MVVGVGVVALVGAGGVNSGGFASHSVYIFIYYFIPVMFLLT